MAKPHPPQMGTPLFIRFAAAGVCLGLMIFVISVVACQVARGPDQASALADSEWEERQWLSKVARFLRNGRPASLSEIEEWSTLSREEVVDRLIAETAFGDTALAFNLYFLGSRPMSLREYDRRWRVDLYTDEIFAEPSAISAAREVLQDGDFLKLVDWEQPVFLAPNTMSQDHRDQVWEVIRQSYDEAAAIVSTHRNDMERACDELKVLDVGEVTRSELRHAGFVRETARHMMWLAWGHIRNNCKNRTADDLSASIEKLKLSVAALFSFAEGISPQNYSLSHVGEIREMDSLNMPVEGLGGTRFGHTGFWEAHPNSSTNFNRKRAKYMLKTFLCDDLTPITLPPVDHAEGRHATDPGCQACHHRLDPMAGLFRYRGALGLVFDRGYMHFDDDVGISGEELEDYLAEWRDPTGARDWNVGIVQSTRDPALNYYSDRIEDLFGAFRRNITALGRQYQPRRLLAQCLTKRMTEFALGPSQLVDGDWVDELSQEWLSNPNSARAFKNTMKRIVLGETFAHADPDPGRCYDVGTPSAVPCQVRSIIRSNCQRCHRVSQPGKLNLSVWHGGEAEGNFEHLDRAGNARTRANTFTSIYCRIQSSDQERLMPPGGMVASERSTLIQWLAEAVGTPDCSREGGHE